MDHHLVNDAIVTTGRMAKRLSWGTYYALVQKYLTLSERKDESERVYIRTLVALLDNFHFPMDEVLPTEPIVEDIDGEGDVASSTEPSKVGGVAQASTTRIADGVNIRLLPKLLAFLEKHEPDTENHTRVSISSGIVTVAKHLPPPAREAQITRLLTILSQMLRSRSQELRDLVQDSLNRIAVNLGASYLPIICRELRTILIRGPQLHVLAHVIHSLIIHVTTGDHAVSFPCLDSCINDVADVASEVIFGESGKDVQAEGFKTKMREVRGSSSRGLDSFTILAKHITPAKISSLLAPVKAIMHETAAISVMGLVDEVLKRITVGLNGNQHISPGDLLTLCNTLISQNAKFLRHIPSRRTNKPKNDVVVQIKRQMTSSTDHYANNSFRYVCRANQILNLTITQLRDTRFGSAKYCYQA
jgi:U3 small nucleolar RNA-associated protein 20